MLTVLAVAVMVDFRVHADGVQECYPWRPGSQFRHVRFPLHSTMCKLTRCADVVPQRVVEHKRSLNSITQ
jgi:hypothetical protein